MHSTAKHTLILPFLCSEKSLEINENINFSSQTLAQGTCICAHIVYFGLHTGWKAFTYHLLWVVNLSVVNRTNTAWHTIQNTLLIYLTRIMEKTEDTFNLGTGKHNSLSFSNQCLAKSDFTALDAASLQNYKCTLVIFPL